MPATSISAMLGITDSDLIGKLDNIINLSADLWKKGLLHHPDFTLHGVEHSENVINNLAQLVNEIDINPPFVQRERFLVAAAAYLHDIGMLISLDSFIQDEMDDLIKRDPDVELLDPEAKRRRVILNLCSEFEEEQRVETEVLSEENRAQTKEMKDGELHRQIHHLLSYWLIMKYKSLFGICDDDEYLYISRISCGHRKVNLQSRMFNDEYLTGDLIRLGVLAALLRLADELDYSKKRVPKIHFEIFQRELLASPISLEHWIRHFFITSSGPFQFTTLANKLKKPVYKINAVAGDGSYKELIESQINKSKRELNKSDLKFQLSRVGFTEPEIDLYFRRDKRAKPLPSMIEKEQKARSYKKFLDDLKERQTILLLKEPTAEKLRNPPSFDEVAKTIGYGVNEVKIQHNWVSEDICKVRFEFEIQAYTNLSIYTNYFGSSLTLETVGNVNCRSLTAGYDVNCQACSQKRNTERKYEAHFNPPLEEGKFLRFVINDIFRNIFLLTEQEISDKIAAGQWDVDEPLEYISFNILRPIRKLRLSIIFPPGYEAKNWCYRVISILGSSLVCPSEFQRISNQFKAKKVQGGSRDALSLMVMEPKMFLNYLLTWSLPSK